MCAGVLVNREAGALDGVELRSNWKYRKREFYQEAIARIQSHGIRLDGCLVLGLDRDPEAVFGVIRRSPLERLQPEAQRP